MQVKNKKTQLEKKAAGLERVLYCLIVAMVLEGLLRKLVPQLNMLLFLLKDVLCVVCLAIIVRTKFSGIVARLNSWWFTVLLLMLPLLFFTAFIDPVLALFALKQYLLYTVTGIAVAVCFPVTKQERFRAFIFFVSLMLIPTTGVAILQNSLPASHWLNLSVGGDSLENFSAAGYLRVSSTFSFTAQYSWFLNAEAFFLTTSCFMPPQFKNRFVQKNKFLVFAVLGLMLAIGMFITGGRTAVIGAASVLIVGGVFIGLKQPAWFFSKGLAIVFVIVIALSGLRLLKPEYFMAYDKRSAGTDDFPHNEEVTNRILDGLTDWTKWFWDQDEKSILVGNGLGVMSNGADQVSAYAAEIRHAGLWMEGDVPTTFWEGGLYLVFVWYGFRLCMVFFCFGLWRRIKGKSLAPAASVLFAYVLIHGLLDQFGMQPPLSIWWWFAIGCTVFIYRLEKYKRQSLSAVLKQQRIQKISAAAKPNFLLQV